MQWMMDIFDTKGFNSYHENLTAASGTYSTYATKSEIWSIIDYPQNHRRILFCAKNFSDAGSACSGLHFDMLKLFVEAILSEIHAFENGYKLLGLCSVYYRFR
jgi:hypothetical protein